MKKINKIVAIAMATTTVATGVAPTIANAENISEPLHDKLNDTIDATDTKDFDKEIHFTDSSLKAAILKQLKKDDVISSEVTIVTKGDMRKLKELHIKRDAGDLSFNSDFLYGMQFAINLEKLTVEDEHYTHEMYTKSYSVDLKPLKDLTKLKEMKLQGNFDLDTIEFNSKLEKLDLSNSDVINFFSVKNLNRIHELKIDNMIVHDNNDNKEDNKSINNDLKSVFALNNLIDFSNISSDNVMSVSPLRGMKKLERLNLSWSIAPDYSDLKELTNLKDVNIKLSNFTDIRDLNGSKELKNINIKYAPIRTLNGISEFKNLKHFSITDTNLNDIDDLKEIGSLDELNLENNQIRDFSALKHLNCKNIKLKHQNIQLVSKNGENKFDIQLIDENGKEYKLSDAKATTYTSQNGEEYTSSDFKDVMIENEDGTYSLKNPYANVSLVLGNWNVSVISPYNKLDHFLNGKSNMVEVMYGSDFDLLKFAKSTIYTNYNVDIKVIKNVDMNSKNYLKNNYTSKQDAKVLVTFEDGTQEEVIIPVYLVKSQSYNYTPKTEKIETSVNRKVDITKYIKNLPSLKDAEKPVIVKDIDYSVLGKQKPQVKIKFADGSIKIITLEADVKNDSKSSIVSNSNYGNTLSYIRYKDPVRISGKDRYETSYESSKIVNSKFIVLANGESFSDALSAQNVIIKNGGKLILTDKYGSKLNIAQLMGDINPERVYIIGGEGSISKNIESEIKNYNTAVIRLGGKDRYETNKKTLIETNIDRVAVADGRNFPDALGASGLLNKLGLGIQLVDGSKPYIPTKEVIYTLGGKNSVKQENGRRLAGKDRYETNRMINSEIGKTEVTTVVDGRDFPDALSAINVVSSKGGSMLLTDNTEKTIDEKYTNDIQEPYVVGGRKSVSQKVIDFLFKNNREKV